MLVALSRLRRLLLGERHEQFEQTVDDTASFALLHGTVVIAMLTLTKGIWAFEYTDAFRAQQSDPRSLKPLSSFPDSKKKYESVELWPFFAARIPSSSQPEVRKRIEQRGIDEKNAAALLAEFGTKSIANTFELRLADAAA